jgi:DNA-binding IclR family transcriptional regulator
MSTTKQATHVIDRAMAIHNALEYKPIGLSLGELAHLTGVQRLVDALKEHSLLIAGRYGARLGPALIRLASAAHLDS